MKKRNLLLSVICSVALVFLLVGFAIVDVIGASKNGKGDGATQNGTNVSQGGSNVSDPTTTVDPVDPSINEGENKGSKEDPYIIYDAQTFIDLVSKYGGKTFTVKQESKEEGEIEVYADETSTYYFKLLRDIDFAGIDYKPLFAGAESFIGTIDGDGHALKNITINVTAENYLDYAYLYTAEDKLNYAKFHLGVFGNTDGATISNITVDGLTIAVDSAVYANLLSNVIVSEGKTYSCKEITIGSLVAYAKNTTVSANVNATINADAYAISSNGKIFGSASLGGLIGETSNVTISDSKVNVTMNIGSNNRNYYLGGLVGRLYESTITGSTVDVNVVSVSAPNALADFDRTYIAGVAGYARTATLSNTIVNLNVSQVEVVRYNGVGNTNIVNDKFNLVAGIFVTVRADDETQKTSIENVTVHSNVDMDAMFAGAIYVVSNAAYDANETVESGKVYITIHNTILDSTVNTLKAFGIGANLLYTKVSYAEDFGYAYYTVNGNRVQYAVKLTGTVNLSRVDGGMEVASVISGNEGDAYTGVKLGEVDVDGYSIEVEGLKAVVSDGIYAQLTNYSKLAVKPVVA